MRASVSVVVPVKDGARYLEELLAAVAAQADRDVDVLVIDSGSTDSSQAIARAAGARVLEIAPADFGHGATRNLGAEQTRGELIAFLTQDATPLPGWLDALRAAFELADDVAAAYGPHRARADTSPMIARELDAFFAGHADPATGGAAIQHAGDEPFLSNVNAAYRRDVFEQIRFADVPYAEDQGFARALLAAGWAKVYAPQMAVAHAHDYPPVAFMRRYFDEYRGLRETIGHVEGAGLRSTITITRNQVAGDRAWMREHGYDAATLARWTARATVHHAGRRVFSALGSRAHALPAAVQRAISLEGTAATASPGPTAADRGQPVAGKPIRAAGPNTYDAVRRYAKHGAAPLLEPLDGQADGSRPLHIACVIPPFGEGSGGHNSIFQMMWRLERAGHLVTYWLADPLGHAAANRPARLRRDARAWFAPVEGPFHQGFGAWAGADVAVATGWQTAHEVVMLPECRARAYLVHDHESEFYATSVEGRWAEATYGLGMHAICSSPWLESIARERYGQTTSTFDFGVDHDVYHPRPVARQPATIAVYGRLVTPRRAVPLALMALQEIAERRDGDLRVLLFGTNEEIDSPVPYEHLGILSPLQLSWAFSEATVGLVLSMTNYSLIPQEMLACGLPCVDLAGISAEGVFGDDGPVALSAFDPLALADQVCTLLDSAEAWERRSAAGLQFVRGRTWDVAAAQVEAGLREAIRLRGGAPEHAA